MRTLTAFTAIVATHSMLAALFFGAAAFGGDSDGGSVVYPLKISENKRYLVDQKNRPFLYHADTGWLLFHKLTRNEVEQYLENRRQKGFNTIQVQILAWQTELTNRDGHHPLAARNDLSKPNEPFFAHVDWVIRKAYQKGIQLTIAPVWLGSGKSGWKDIMKANGPEKCREFGRYLGQRYRDFPNLMWLMGGDRDPGEYRQVVNALAEGIKETDPNHLMTAHAGSPMSAAQQYPTESWLDVNTTYCYSPNITSVGRPQFHVYAASLADYNRTPVKPFFLVESAYENERNSKPQWITRQAYWCILSGSTGQAIGNHPIYEFGPGWQKEMENHASRDMARLYKFFGNLPWHKLVPDQKHEVLVAGYGTFDSEANKNESYAVGLDYVTAAYADDGSLLIAYLPTPRTVTVDMNKLSGKVTARWFDPTSGEYLPVPGSPFENAGKRGFTPPARNPSGDGDWVLVLEVVSEASSISRRGTSE